MFFCILGPKVLFKKGKKDSTSVKVFVVSYYKQDIERRNYG